MFVVLIFVWYWLLLYICCVVVCLGLFVDFVAVCLWLFCIVAINCCFYFVWICVWLDVCVCDCGLLCCIGYVVTLFVVDLSFNLVCVIVICVRCLLA